MGRMLLLEEAEGDRAEGFALIRKADVRLNSKGAEYMDLVLADTGGEIPAKLWDYRREEHGEYSAGDVVKVRGLITVWKDAEQLKIEKIRYAAPGEADMSRLIPCAPVDPMSAYAAILKTVSGFRDGDIRELTLSILKASREKFLVYPAAVKLHHATRGGLVHHTLSVLRLAKAVAEAYPYLNEDLLYAGAILHDIGKLREMDTDGTGLAGAYTAEGMLIGHVCLGVIDVAITAKELGTPPEKVMWIEHMLLAHHGQPEYGSPKYPMFPEAEALSQLDMLDSRLYEMRAALEGVRERGFTERQWPLDNRQLYRISGEEKRGEERS